MTPIPRPDDSAAPGAVPVLALTYRRAAQALGVSERTIWQLVHDGRLHACRIGRCVRISLSELQRYIDRQTSQGGAPH